MAQIALFPGTHSPVLPILVFISNLYGSGPRGGLAGGVAFSHPRTNDHMVQPRGFSPVPQYPVLCYPGDNIFLPRPEFPKFNGDPQNFTTFKNEFVKYIVPKVSDHKMLLCYLLQHCETKVRDKIQHFSNKGDAGYALACERLEREYGRPNIIADACEQRLKAAKAVKSNDPVGLKLFSELLEQTPITLEDIRCFGSLSSLDTMAQLIQKLPFDSRRAWVKESVKVEQETGQVADFSHFAKFVNRLSDEANSLYGRRVLGTQSTKPPSKAQTTPDIRKSASSYNVTSKPTSSNSSKPATSIPFACFYCKDINHGLLECAKFRGAPLHERSKFIKENKFCYKCLGSRHRTQGCTKQNTCKVKGCTGTFHLTLLHPSQRNLPDASKDTDASTPAPDIATSSSTSPNNSAVFCSSAVCSVYSNESPQRANAVYLCVVPVRVNYGTKQVVTYAFLDQGSTHTFCNQKLVKALGISGVPNELTLNTLTGSKSHQGYAFSLSVSSLTEDETFNLHDVLSIEDIPVTPNAIPVDKDLNSFPHLRDLNFPKVHGATVTLLIGANVPELFCTRNVRKGARGQPIAVQTPLGWSLLGPSLFLSTFSNCSVNFVTSDQSLQSQISRLWETDFGNQTSIFDIPTSKEDRIAYDIMNNSVKFVAGHYQLPLPWKSGLELPTDSHVMAERRLSSLNKRLTSNTVLCSKYVDEMETYISKGYARRVPYNPLVTNNAKWYLPHHPVLHPRKPDKVRVVFDCAAKHKGISLNDALYQGPVLTNSLVGVLIRFRENPIALVADIEQMFHQIKVDPIDCDALRFLWWPDGNFTQPPVTYQMLVHLFGATSSPKCAAFSLRQTAYDYGKKFDSSIANIVLQNFYVDDCLCSVSTITDGIKVTKQLPALLRCGGFRLTKWLTNHKQVLQSIPATERASSVQQHELDGDVKERVLGVYWNV